MGDALAGAIKLLAAVDADSGLMTPTIPGN
jgi:hypothetical protein